MGRSFPLRCFAESASHSGRSKWDTLSQRRSNGKLRPIIRSRNGMHFPNESKTGKCIPQSVLKVGRRFPMRLKWKMHPGIGLQSGPPFPKGAARGNFVPFFDPRVGHAFPLSFQRKVCPSFRPQSGTHFPDRLQAENASQNQSSNWVARSRRGSKRKVRPAFGNEPTRLLRKQALITL